MEPRLNIVTIGIKDLRRAVHFYRDGLIWPLSCIRGGDFAIFKSAPGRHWPSILVFARQRCLR